MKQLTFDEVTAISQEDAKEDAITRAEGGADQEWFTLAEYIVKTLCETRETFTTDAVWNELKECKKITRDPRSMGAVMRRAARCRWCELTGTYTPSVQERNHKRPVALWRSLLLPSHE